VAATIDLASQQMIGAPGDGHRHRFDRAVHEALQHRRPGHLLQELRDGPAASR
jgi:hypothetical protein